jgi:hypothetical protein
MRKLRMLLAAAVVLAAAKGQVGNGSTLGVPAPAEVLSGATGISAGSLHSLALEATP